jgi:hypothetical protein
VPVPRYRDMTEMPGPLRSASALEGLAADGDAGVHDPTSEGDRRPDGGLDTTIGYVRGALVR